MSKRRKASELMFGQTHALKYPVHVVAAGSGTGTDTRGGVITVVFGATTATSAYITIQTGTNIGTLVGTAAEIPSP